MTNKSNRESRHQKLAPQALKQIWLPFSTSCTEGTPSPTVLQQRQSEGPCQTARQQSAPTSHVCSCDSTSQELGSLGLRQSSEEECCFLGPSTSHISLQHNQPCPHRACPLVRPANVPESHTTRGCCVPTRRVTSMQRRLAGLPSNARWRRHRRRMWWRLRLASRIDDPWTSSAGLSGCF